MTQVTAHLDTPLGLLALTGTEAELSAGQIEEARKSLQPLLAQAPNEIIYNLAQIDIDDVVAAAQRASSMRGNPIALSDAEVSEIVSRSL